MRNGLNTTTETVAVLEGGENDEEEEEEEVEKEEEEEEAAKEKRTLGRTLGGSCSLELENGERKLSVNLAPTARKE